MDVRKLHLCGLSMTKLQYCLTVHKICILWNHLEVAHAPSIAYEHALDRGKTTDKKHLN